MANSPTWRFVRPPAASRRLAAVAALAIGLLAALPLAGQHEAPLRVGAVPYKTDAAFGQTYEPLIERLGTALGGGATFESVGGEDLAYGLMQGDIDLAIFTPFPYLAAQLDFPELEVFASHRVRGEEEYRGGLVVRRESALEALEDLRNVAVLWVKATSTSGFKLPQGILRENGLFADAEPEFSGAHATSLRRLLDGEVEAIAVDLDALADLSDEDRLELRVIEEYSVPYHAYVLSPKLSGEQRLRITEALLTAHHNPEIRPLFDNPLGIERWIARDDVAYNSVRRFLGMLRTKPQLRLVIELKQSARRVLEARGDFLAVLEDAMKNELSGTGRFEVLDGESGGLAREVVVNLALVGDTFHCQSHLDGRWLRSLDLPEAGLMGGLPGQVAHDVVAAVPLTAPLLFNGSEWFITYGTNDGIDLERYDIVVGEGPPLPPAAIRAITPLNIIFAGGDRFRRGEPVTLAYRGPSVIDQTELGLLASGEGTDTADRQHADASGLRAFWDNLDNRWGVIGLLVASISVAFGGYLRLRKQRRFRTVLNESLDLLRLYLEGKYDLQARLVEQREKILSYLERNFINENQYLILKHHLDEVETVIGQLATQDVADTQEVQAELKQIVVDGKVTAEELEHLAATLRDATHGDEPVS